jgi:hypothetical protein
MKKIIFILALITTPVFAAKLDFTQLGGGHGDKLQMCTHHAWRAAGTSESQNQQAHQILMGAKAIVDQNKDAVHAAMHVMFAAWGKAPIVRDEVITGENGLKAAIEPVMSAGRDARIDIINLLNSSQRARFDATLHQCMHSR